MNKFILLTAVFFLISMSPAFAWSFCYQESANVSTACGGLDNGTYSNDLDWNASNPWDNVVDGNWNTFGTSEPSIGRVYVNYTIPADTNLSTIYWQVKDNWSTRNYTVPASCIGTGYWVYFRIYSIGTVHESNWDCWNKTAGNYYTINYTTTTSGWDYEEGVYWNVSYTPITNFMNMNITTPINESVEYSENVPFNFTCSAPDTSTISYNFTLNGTMQIEGNMTNATYISGNLHGLFGSHNITLNCWNPYNTTNINTSVAGYSTNFNLSVCAVTGVAVSRNQTINFTLRNESDPTKAVSGIFPSIDFNLWNGNLSKNITLANTTAGPFTYYCIYPNQSSIMANVTITASASGYQARTMAFNNLALTNVSTNLSIYLLNISEGFWYNFIVLDYNNNPIPNVMINASRSMSGTYTPVEVETSDSTGTANFYLNSNQYLIEASKSGYDTVAFYLIPSYITHVTYIRLTPTSGGTSALINLTTPFDNVTSTLSPAERYWNTSIHLNYTVHDTTSNLTGSGWLIYYQNMTGDYLLVNQSSTVASGHSFTYTTPNSTGFYKVSTYFTKTSYSPYWTPNITYYMNYNSTLGFGVPLSNWGFGKITLELVAIVITLFVVAFFSRWNIMAGAIIGLGVLAIFTFGLGFVPVFPEFALTMLVMLALMLLRGFV